MKTLIFFFALVCCVSKAAGQIDKTQLLENLKYISSDAMGGRDVASEGSKLTRELILSHFEQLEPVHPTYCDTFSFLQKIVRKEYLGINIVGKVTGTKYPEKYIVIGAHYDHVGVRDGQVYNGADDNGSGTAALLSLIPYFVENKPEHSIIFAAWDAEEKGLEGAFHFVKNGPIEKDDILVNFNMDMISRNPAGVLNICGTMFHKGLKPIVKQASKNSKAKLTYDHEGRKFKGANNWTEASDHYAFGKYDIPYLYFGVEDHADYHMPGDDYEKITPEFYYQVVLLVHHCIREFDHTANGERID